MRVLLVYMNTAGRTSFPIGLTNLSSYLGMLGHEVRIFDTTFYRKFAANRREVTRGKLGFYKPIENPVDIEWKESDVLDDLSDMVGEIKPDIIGFSILSCHFFDAIGLSDSLKEIYPDIPIIFGGLHPSIMPEETISANSVNMICVGEGEYAMAELLEKMSERRDIKTVKNIWVKQDGKIYKNEIRRLIDLDELPVLNWSLFSDQHSYGPLNGRMHRMGSVEFSRGCPFSCNYCSCIYLRRLTAPQKYLRRKSVEKAVSDLVELKNRHNLEMFYFLDESFLSMPLKTLEVFSAEYKREVGLPFHAMTHPLSVNREKARMLKRMGCYLITMGIECGNQKFRKDVLNRNIPNSSIIEAFKVMRENGILASAFGMVGLPFETRPLIFETIEMFRQCNPETCAVGIYAPFLGSELRKICIDEGFFDPMGDDYNYPDTTSVLNMPQLTAKEIEGLYKTFYLYTKMPREYFGLLDEAERDEERFAQVWKAFENQP